MVSPEESANKPEWWTDERYAIYDLSNNSAIAYPAHEEQLCLVGAPEKYRAKGYAYGGGGRRITRVEISIDKAKTWRLAQIEYPEDAYREAEEEQELFGGKLDMSWRETCFCWCFWHLDIPVKELAEAKDILVRSMDESMHTQPRDMYWSVLGMMNNPWFRVTISKENDFLRFEHPTQPALLPGGWMERVKKAGGNLTNGHWGESLGGEGTEVPPEDQASAEIKLTKDGVDKIISMDELRKHDGADSPWFVVSGDVFDGTKFLEGHPGGAQSILSAAGMDVTDEFLAIRKWPDEESRINVSLLTSNLDSETAKAMMPDYHVGTLDEKSKAALIEGEVAESGESEPREVFLRSKVWSKAVLHKKDVISSDTRIFTFKLDHDEQALGLPTGQHLMIRLRDPVTREAIIRAYTPTSHESSKGSLEVLIKVYFDSPERKGGKMSQAMDALPIGHGVDFKGPIGKLIYYGNGRCTINDKERHVKRFVMFCAGSGVTPIFQVYRSIMMNKQDKTQVVVLNGNRLAEDILCKDELDQYAEGNDDKCKLLYTLTQASDDWKGLKGRIGPDLIKEHCPLGPDSMALICGPEPMEKATHKALLEQGWKDEDLLFF